MLHGITQDVRLALRTLRATPFVTSILIVSGPTRTSLQVLADLLR